MRAERLRELLGNVALALVATVVTFGIGEALLRIAYAARNSFVTTIPLPYVLGHSYGPAPPWGEGLRILEPDGALMWRLRPDARRRYLDVFSPVQVEDDRFGFYRRFFPSLPESLKRNPTWEIRLNSRGFRTAEFEASKPANTLRIVCLGDSWTFGANVGQEDAYPQRLQALLREAFPTLDVEVLNLGVLGYSSFQGRELLRRFALGLQPDVVLIGLGMNDSSVSGYRDKDVAGTKPPAWKRLLGLVRRSEVFRLVSYIALAARYRPKSIANSIKEQDAKPRTFTTADYDAIEPWTRVSPHDYENNLTEMATRARSRGASVVLLFPELSTKNPYRGVAARVAKNLGVPFVDVPDILARAKREAEADLERRLGLEPERSSTEGAAREASAIAGDEVEVVFRAYANGYPVPRALYIAGAHPALGDLVPNRTPLRDDGTQGDQRAGDGVWSYAARFRPGTRLSYVYTNSGGEGRWEGLDVPALRTLTVEAPGGRRVYRPLELFGSLLLQADTWHTDARGYTLIAQAILEALARDEHVRGLRDRQTRGSGAPGIAAAGGK